MDARDALRRVLADPRAGQGGRFEGGRMPAGPYEDEPILRTGSELAASHAAAGAGTLADGVDAAREERREARRQQRSAWPQTGGARQVAHAMGGAWPGDDEPARAYDDEVIPMRGVPGASAARQGEAWGTARSLRVEAPAPARRSWSPGTWAELERPEAPLPESYRVARDFARGPEARRHSDAWVFRRQAEMLAHVTDDAPYDGHFERYFPTYQAMSNAQLRGYITWRTAVRAGDVRRTSPSFAYVYVYEHLVCAGSSGPAEAFAKLLAFWTAYRELDTTLDRHLRVWMRDFAVYYGLPVETARLVPAVETQIALDTALHVVTNPQGHAPEERFDALSALASYRIRSSRFAKEQPRDVMAVTLGVVGRLERHYAARRKAGLYETLFGRRMQTAYRMFKDAVFEEDAPHADATYVLDEMTSYVCSRGSWFVNAPLVLTGPSAELGAVLKTVDARMRVRYGYEHPLREPTVPKYVAKYVEQEIDAWLEWKAAHTPRRIEIDRSKLGGIRTTAAQTREELLVDEERGEDAPGFGLACGLAAPAGSGVPAPAPVPAPALAPTPAPASPASAPAPAAPDVSTAVDAGGPMGLTPQELAFVRSLLAGRPQVPPGPLASADMLVDAVNEKLFDALGDVAVEFGDDGPAIIEDYLDDVRGIVLA